MSNLEENQRDLLLPGPAKQHVLSIYICLFLIIERKKRMDRIGDSSLLLDPKCHRRSPAAAGKEQHFFFFEKWEGATLSPLLLIIPNVSANEGCGEHQGIASRGALRIIVAIRSSARIGPIWLPLVA